MQSTSLSLFWLLAWLYFLGSRRLSLRFGQADFAWKQNCLLLTLLQLRLKLTLLGQNTIVSQLAAEYCSRRCADFSLLGLLRSYVHVLPASLPSSAQSGVQKLVDVLINTLETYQASR